MGRDDFAAGPVTDMARRHVTALLGLGCLVASAWIGIGRMAGAWALAAAGLVLVVAAVMVSDARP